jgi:phosphoglycolate phosphatase-like HAD superfamily hydrolase
MRMAFDNSRHDASLAVLFDVDGTLVDSNYLHVHAWQRAFLTEDVTVETWRIHRCIGMDGSALVKTLSDDADDDVRNRLKDKHSRYYQETASMLTPLPGARELLHRIADLGLQVVLATSAPDDELAMLREVLDCDDIVSAGAGPAANLSAQAPSRFSRTPRSYSITSTKRRSRR